MAKRDVIKPIASVTAAIATWTELGREFKLGDASCGEVGLVNTVGRIALKMTGSILAYTLTDCCFDWLFNAKDKVASEVHAGKENTEDEEEPDDTEEQQEESVIFEGSETDE